MNRTSKITGCWKTRDVFVDGFLLRPYGSQLVWNHSPDGFNWNYGGSGPAQLALALLLEVTDKEEAVKYHQDFKWDVIAKLPQADFSMSAESIYAWLEGKRKK